MMMTNTVVKKEQNDSDDDDGSDDNEDDELKAAKSAMNSTNDFKSATATVTTAIYKPPRLFSTGMDSFSQREKQEHLEMKEKRRQRQRMLQNTEVLQTLRSEYTDMPEEEDIKGGTNLAISSSTGAGAGAGGKMGFSSHSNMTAARRKFEIRDREKTKFEEEQFVRLVPTRKEKKERNRVFAEERSNLKEISDLGNLTRGITEFTNDSNYGNTKHRERERDTDGWEGRFDNGKRKRGVDMGLERGGTRRVREGTKIRKIRNPLQKEALGIRTSNKKKKKNKR